MIQKYYSKSADETMQIAQKIAENVKNFHVFVLSGDLGAGKTTFTKGFALGLGIKEIVTSPTFTIMNSYQGTKFPLFHFDMYRLEGVDEAYALGFEEYFDTSNLKGICLVEWAENVENLILKPYTKITFNKVNDDEREIILEDIVWKF